MKDCNLAFSGRGWTAYQTTFARWRPMLGAAALRRGCNPGPVASSCSSLKAESADIYGKAMGWLGILLHTGRLDYLLAAS
jgi:hypothetical protein